MSSLQGPDEAGPLQVVQGLVCDNLALYASKYQDEFSPYIRDCVTAVWHLLMALGLEEKNDTVVASGIKFLSF